MNNRFRIRCVVLAGACVMAAPSANADIVDRVKGNKGLVGVFIAGAVVSAYQQWRIHKAHKRIDAIPIEQFMQYADQKIEQVRREVAEKLAQAKVDLAAEAVRLRALFAADAQGVRDELKRLCQEREALLQDLDKARVDLERVQHFVRTAIEHRGQHFMDDVLLAMRDIDLVLTRVRGEQRTLETRNHVLELSTDQAFVTLDTQKSRIDLLESNAASLIRIVEERKREAESARAIVAELEGACARARKEVNAARDRSQTLAREAENLDREIRAVRERARVVKQQSESVTGASVVEAPGAYKPTYPTMPAQPSAPSAVHEVVSRARVVLARALNDTSLAQSAGDNGRQRYTNAFTRFENSCGDSERLTVVRALYNTLNGKNLLADPAKAVDSALLSALEALISKVSR